jgi:hypothetical protein
MVAPVNHQILLRSRPEGTPSLDNFTLNQRLGVGARISRGWRHHGGRTVGEVVASRNPNFAVGDIVMGCYSPAARPLARFQPVLNDSHSIENALDLVAGFAHKYWDEFPNRAFDRAGAHHLELDGAS